MKNLYLITIFLLSAAPAFAAAPRQVVLVPQGAGVEVRASATGAWAPVSGRTVLETGAEVRTVGEAKAGVFLPDGSHFLIEKNSVFGVEDTSKKKTGFSLLAGRLKARVAGYFASKFAVRTPTAVCAVRGTEFDIEVGKEGNTEMNVAEGLVEVNDSKGQMAVVSSEEKISIGADGMSKPELMSLKDERAGEAARPMAVRVETARERTRTMMEELRNRELKANEAQLGKDSIDAFGRRVRLEEYLLRPTSKEFQVLFISKRTDQDRLDWGHLIERFNADIPDDISQVAGIIDGMYFSDTAPANWLKYFEVYLTNTVDSIKETIDFTAPVAINFSGYGLGTKYYPGSIDYRQILSGPGVAAAAGAGSLVGTGLASLAADERVQFRQTQDWNTSTANRFTWMQKVVNGSGVLTDMWGVTLNPTSAVDIGNQGTQTYYDAAVDPGNATVTYPSGPGMADFMAASTYADGSTVSSRKLLVSNEGEILRIPGSPNSNTFLAEGSFNLEVVIGSNLFQGRDIDVLFAPEILTQKKDAVLEPGTSNIQ